MKKKGFTLIELMIVLAVIAILAVVLIPRAGAFKNNAKNAGVTTNVNAVRAILETKTGNNFASDATKVISILDNAFNTATSSVEENVINPFNNANTVANGTISSAPAVYVNTGTVTSLTNLKGSVVVEFSATSYKIYGVDNTGTKVDEVTISK